MKIYVDGELPECCNDCEFGYFYDCQYCSLRPDLAREDIWVEKEKYCPLQSLDDYTKQVRNEVLDIIEEKFNCCGYVEEKFEDIKKYVLDQLQGESKCLN